MYKIFLKDLTMTLLWMWVFVFISVMVNVIQCQPISSSNNNALIEHITKNGYLIVDSSKYGDVTEHKSITEDVKHNVKKFADATLLCPVDEYITASPDGYPEIRKSVKLRPGSNLTHCRPVVRLRTYLKIKESLSNDEATLMSGKRIYEIRTERVIVAYEYVTTKRI